MTFPILGGNGAVGTYSIDNSLRFNQSDDPSLIRTPSSTGNRKTFTWSGWVKRGADFGTRQVFFGADNSADTNASYIRFTDDETIQAYLDNGNSLESNLNTSAKFRDVSAWYHIVWAVDTTQGTDSNRSKVYVNGSQVTSFQSPNYPSLNYDTDINTQEPHYVGSDTTGVANDFALDGYMAEVHFIDGQALSPTDFGEFDEDSGIWKPIQYTGSYGTNGFYLDFENSGSLGTDQSGNGNNFTPTNLASTDQTTDTPTNNFATLNPLWRNSANLGVSAMAEGNLKPTLQANGGISLSTQGADTSKWYAEVKISDSFQSEVEVASFDYYYQYTGNGGKPDARYYYDGRVWVNGSLQGTFSSYTTNDIISIALDLDNNKIYFAKNGTYINSANPSAGTGGFSITATKYLIGCAQASGSDRTFGEFNFGNPSFSISSGNSDDNGYGNFEYAPPSGYLALCTQNLATALSPTIDDGSAYFHTQLYTGDGTTGRSITNDANAGDFQPDFLWIKERSSTSSHRLTDSSRGVNKVLISSGTNAELTRDEIGSYDTDGFTIDGTTDGVGAVNENTQTYAAWQWKANGGTTSSNTDGSITSTVQANTTAGFSIVTYTGDGGTDTIGHGLSQAPEVFIIKRRDSANIWTFYTTAIDGSLDYGFLEQTVAFGNAGEPLPTSSVFTIPNVAWTNASGGTYVAYCFHSVEGYSKFGSYTGNGSTDGTFVYTGFRPAFVIIKRTDSTSNWTLYDSVRNTYNEVDELLYPNLSNNESTNDASRKMDFLSNGFKFRGSGGSIAEVNASGGSYIYICFSANPFCTSTGIPVTAR